LDKENRRILVSAVVTKQQICTYCDIVKGGVLALTAVGMPFLVIAAMYM
tara:strand:+ start:167 stop:313 length:147 start_codon:yes stop_codon:yes gene_type:complete